MMIFPTPKNNTRLGFHYYPDTAHYRMGDLQKWLPELRAIGASWLTLLAPSDRAIPEHFLRGLIEADIEPILHFPFSNDGSGFRVPEAAEMISLFASYARWGVHYVILFDRPNLRLAWPASGWAQNDLVERFLDRYLPLAQAAAQCGLTPVFPPLEPGGDFWDTVFLRTALQAAMRREQNGSLEKFVLSAYARAGERPLDWGSGGPERWPGARPYFTPPGSEDQRGFRIFDWYLRIAEAVFGNPCPLLLLGAGSYPASTSDASSRRAASPTDHGQRNLSIARTLLENASTGRVDIAAEPLDPIPAAVLACNFWLLTAVAQSPHLSQAWFQPDGSVSPLVAELRAWASSRSAAPTSLSPALPKLASSRPIAHYLLIPAYEWGVADWHLDVIRPFIKKYRPTVGFSLAEAALAGRVTVVGGENDFPDSALNELRAAGCFVERIERNGTSIATRLHD